MLEVKIICVGKLKERYWREAVEEYAKRLSAFCRFSVVELNEARLPQNPGAAEIERALAEESKAIAAAAVGGASSLAFVIGSSHGLHDSVKSSGRRISMSPMTFPHQLARVMLCEQLYRAFSINAGTKYHK